MNEDIIRDAISGNEEALNIVLINFTPYIKSLAWDGNNYNLELEGEMKTALLLAVLKFKVRQ